MLTSENFELLPFLPDPGGFGVFGCREKISPLIDLLLVLKPFLDSRVNLKLNPKKYSRNYAENQKFVIY